MNDDFEDQLRLLQPAAPPAQLKDRLRAHFEPETPKLPIPFISIRRLIPVTAGVLALGIAGLALSPRAPSVESTAGTISQVPTHASTSLYFQNGEPPLQVTRTSSQAYVAWHDAKAGQEIVTTFPCEQIVISAISIQ
jgi:hypothetical protein